MSSVESASYVSKTTQSLLFHTKPSLIESIEERRVDRMAPSEKSDDFRAGQTLTMNLTNDQMVDPQSICLNFKLSQFLADGVTPSVGYINGAMDVIQKLSIHYNDILVEEFDHANYWANTFLYFSANKSYFETEGQSLLGMAPRYLDRYLGATATTTTGMHLNCGTAGKDFTIPLALVSPFLRNKFFLPLFGAHLRITMVLAPNIEVLTRFAVAGNVYRLNNVSFTYDSVILTPTYRQALIAQLRSEEGIRIPYTSYNTVTHTCAASGTNNIRFQYNLVNALSLFLLHNPVVAKTADAVKWKYVSHSFPCPAGTFTKMDITSGSKRFTPNDGVKTFPELYASAEKCIGSLCDISGSGIIDRDTFEGAYAEDGDFKTCTAGLCLFACNLEKTTENDDSLINSGISSAQGLNTFDIRLETGATLGTSEWLINVAHKRALKLSGSGTNVDS